MASVEDCLSQLETSADGLSAAEAQKRHQKRGPNALPKVPGPPVLGKFVAQFTHRMAILLWVAALIAGFAGLPQLAVAIAAVNVINGLFSFWQEFRAQKATEALQRLLPRWARVRREGVELRIPAEELVCGDILLLGEGEHISADARLIWGVDFRIDQSVLTGESRAVARSPEPSQDPNLARIEQPNLVFAGSTVACGSGRAVVLAIAGETEFGRIAHLTQSLPETPSPLQLEMERLTRTVSYLVMGVGAVFFLLAVGLTGMHPAQGFLFALGMIVAFVPEGLPPTVTLSLAMGVQRMAGRNALVKRLSAVETLGCTNVICTDKTGTLTQNQMTVRELYINSGNIRVGGTGYDPSGQFFEKEQALADPLSKFGELLRAVSLCNDARLVPPSQDAGWTVLGDPTEGALQTLAAKAGLSSEELTRDRPRLGEAPFDSRRKRMSTVHKLEDGFQVYVKGAPREVLEVCTHYQDNGQVRPMEPAVFARLMAANDEMARSGLRVLAVASRSLQEHPPAMKSDELEQSLTLLGLIGMHDPPRAEVEAAVQLCHRAGVRILMITGDYGLTAESVARKIGIIRGPQPKIVIGTELESMAEDELVQLLGSNIELIFARVAPEQKLRVVKGLQQLGRVVAVTGDGVNDAPALRQADIGVAMGRSGSDVAREAAAMVLTDDSFASIVYAIEEGRAVYANLRRFVSYIFTSNVPEAFPFIFFAFSGAKIPLALNIMQILAIDLGTDMLPALALGVEPPEPGLMDRPPRDRAKPLITAGLLARAYLYLGIVSATAVMISFFAAYWMQAGWYGHWLDLPARGQLYKTGCSMAFATVVMTQVGNLFAHRTEVNSIMAVGLGGNPFLWWGVAAEMVVLLSILYVPFLQRVFECAPLSPQQWLLVLAWTPALLVADEIRKALLRARRKA
ncbi:cation-transporting P-type ATPase [bacterium]|nr:cation-transporting P-type ATPase [bacterium]